MYPETKQLKPYINRL